MASNAVFQQVNLDRVAQNLQMRYVPLWVHLAGAGNDRRLAEQGSTSSVSRNHPPSLLEIIIYMMSCTFAYEYMVSRLKWTCTKENCSIVQISEM